MKKFLFVMSFVLIFLGLSQKADATMVRVHVVQGFEYPGIEGVHNGYEFPDDVTVQAALLEIFHIENIHQQYVDESLFIIDPNCRVCIPVRENALEDSRIIDFKPIPNLNSPLSNFAKSGQVVLYLFPEAMASPPPDEFVEYASEVEIYSTSMPEPSLINVTVVFPGRMQQPCTVLVDTYSLVETLIKGRVIMWDGYDFLNESGELLCPKSRMAFYEIKDGATVVAIPKRETFECMQQCIDPYNLKKFTENTDEFDRKIKIMLSGEQSEKFRLWDLANTRKEKRSRQFRKFIYNFNPNSLPIQQQSHFLPTVIPQNPIAPSTDPLPPFEEEQ